MHKPFYLVALFAATISITTAEAQTTKGTRVLGLSAGNITYENENSSRRISGRLSPSIGTFIADNVAFGVALPVGYSMIKYSNGMLNQQKQRSWGLGLLPWVRYYLPSTSWHRVFGELSVGGELASYKTKTPDSVYKGSDVSLSASLGVGYSYFITPNVGLETLVKYAINGGSFDRFGRGYLDVNLGFRVYLPKGGAIVSNQ